MCTWRVAALPRCLKNAGRGPARQVAIVYELLRDDSRAKAS